MKKILSIALILAMLFSFAACNKDNPDVEQNSDETQKTEWQEAYELALQEYVNDDIYFTSVYIDDVNGDGVPMIAFTTNPFFYKIPNVVLNYVDGKVVEHTDYREVDSGSVVSNSYYFINGTNDIVYRSYGNTTGTFGVNELQQVYSIVDGKYELVSEETFVLSDDLLTEYQAMLANGEYDITKYQNDIFDMMDEEIKNVTGAKPLLINYQEVAKNFMVELEDEIDSQMKESVNYVNKELGINVTLENNASEDEKDEDGALNLEEYTGEWVADYLGSGLYEKIITINSIKGNEINFSFYQYRVFSIDNQTAEIGGDGIVKVNYSDEYSFLVGEIALGENKIKLNIEDTSIPYIEKGISVYERANYEPKYKAQKGFANYIENWDTATKEEKFWAGDELVWDIMRYQYDKDLYHIRTLYADGIVPVENDGLKIVLSQMDFEGNKESYYLYTEGMVMYVYRDCVRMEMSDNGRKHVWTYDWNGNQVSYSDSENKNANLSFYEYAKYKNL